MFVQDQLLIVTNGGTNTKTQVLKFGSFGDEAVAVEEVHECANSLEFQKELQWATGGVIAVNEEIVICGGTEVESSAENQMCFSHGDSHVHKLAQTGALRETRIGAASLVIDNGTTLWITGGHNSKNRLQTTETVTMDPKTTGLVVALGLNLPKTLSYHCLTKVSDGLAFLTGGEKYEVTDQTGEDLEVYSEGLSWSINFNTMSWTTESQMEIPRSRHSCGALKDSMSSDSSRKVIVVAGGETKQYGEQEVLQSVELLVIEDKASFMVSSRQGLEWAQGPYLPAPILDAASVVTADQLKMYVIGGSTYVQGIAEFQPLATIYEFHCSDLQCEWKQVYEMRRSMTGGLAFFMPSDSIEADLTQHDAKCPKFNETTGK